MVKLLGRYIGYTALCNGLGSLWNAALGFSVIDLENDYLFVRFQSERDAEFALTQGPWTIMGHYLIVQLWTPRFDNSMEEIESVIAWIHLLGMALHYYHKKILRMLGQIIGSIIKVDYNNESATRGKFARLTVEVALTKPLISQFFLDGKVQKVEYEGLPTICFGCGKYGHTHEACPNHAAGSVSGVKRVDINQVNIDLPVPEGSGEVAQHIPKFGPRILFPEKENLERIKERRFYVIQA